MVRYRIHKLKNTQRENFRWTAHTSGLAVVKLKDYDATGEVEAATPYAAWKTLQTEDRPLSPGDLLETIKEDGSPGELLIAKYIGFEPAAWHVPEPKPDAVTIVTAEPPLESK
jgi:hypothetical protein